MEDNIYDELSEEALQAQLDSAIIDGACPRCSGFSSFTYHGSVCDRDPELPKNIIVTYFRKRNPNYIGIIWEAIANHCIYALEEAGYIIIKKK